MRLEERMKLSPDKSELLLSSCDEEVLQEAADLLCALKSREPRYAVAETAHHCWWLLETVLGIYRFAKEAKEEYGLQDQD